VPDFYQGTELLDLSLVDPDNRRPVDYGRRTGLLEELEPLLDHPDPAVVAALVAAGGENIKLYIMVRLLRFRQAHPAPFAGGYQAMEAEGPRSEHLLAYAREASGQVVVVAVPRFPARLDRLGGWGDTRIPVPESWRGKEWTEVLTGKRLVIGESVYPSALPLLWTVLFSHLSSGDGLPGESGSSGA
jgi:(1->4)-alpha-D-glucan 1-alpha-D-glucosylmutase